MKITDLEDLYNMFFVLFKKAGVINDDGLVNDDKEFHGLLLKMVDNINYIKTFRSTVLDDDTNLVNELIIFIHTVDISYIENEKDFDEFASNNYIISSSQSDNGLYSLVISVNNARIISSGEVGRKDITGTSQMKKSLNILSEIEDLKLEDVIRSHNDLIEECEIKIENSYNKIVNNYKHMFENEFNMLVNPETKRVKIVKREKILHLDECPILKGTLKYKYILVSPREGVSFYVSQELCTKTDYSEYLIEDKIYSMSNKIDFPFTYIKVNDHYLIVEVLDN